MLSAPCCHYYCIKSSSAHSLLLLVNLSPTDLLLCFYYIRTKIGKSVCFWEGFFLIFLSEIKFIKRKIICLKVQNSVVFSVLTMLRAQVSTMPCWPGQHRNLWGWAQPPLVLLYIHPTLTKGSFRVPRFYIGLPCPVKITSKRNSDWLSYLTTGCPITLCNCPLWVCQAG